MTPTVGNDLSLTLAPQAALSHTKSNAMTPTMGIGFAPQAALSITNSLTLTPTVGNSLSNHMIKSRSSSVYSGKY